MATLAIKDANGDIKYLEVEGSGTVGDPYSVVHSVEQATHDNANVNANMQVGDADVGLANPVPVKFGTAISLPAGTNNIGDVDVLSIAAGETHIGQVSGHGKIVEVTLSLDTGGAYADGDVMADSQAADGVARTAAGYAKLVSLEVIDEDDQGEALDLYFLSANVSLGTENSPPNISDTNARNVLGKVPIAAADFYDLGGVRIASKMEKDLGMLLKAATGGTAVYVGAIARGTPTYTASGVRLRIGVEQY